MFLLTSEKGSTLKENNLPPPRGGGGGKFFSFRVDPFLDGASFAKRQTGSLITFSVVENGGNLLKVPSSLNLHLSNSILLFSDAMYNVPSIIKQTIQISPDQVLLGYFYRLIPL